MMISSSHNDCPLLMTTLIKMIALIPIIVIILKITLLVLYDSTASLIFMTIMLIVIIALRFQWLCAIQDCQISEKREKIHFKRLTPRLNKNSVTQLTKWWRSPYRLTGPTVGTVLIYQIKKRNFLNNEFNFLNTTLCVKESNVVELQRRLLKF